MSSSEEIYNRLLRFVAREEQLKFNGYPRLDRALGLGLFRGVRPEQLNAVLAPRYTCLRCNLSYEVDAEGVQVDSFGRCNHHTGHWWKIEGKYSCCGAGRMSAGCAWNDFHVHEGELLLANYQDYVETSPKPELEPNRHGVYALDCEMSYTTHGLELTQVTVVDHNMRVVYETLVKPKNRILDYNTKFTGLDHGDLAYVEKSLADVQRDLLQMFSNKTIIVGHSLEHDFKALKLSHGFVIDTSLLYPHRRGPPLKRGLKTLMREVLGTSIQDGASHDSREDARATLKLAMKKAGLV